MFTCQLHTEQLYVHFFLDARAWTPNSVLAAAAVANADAHANAVANANAEADLGLIEGKWKWSLLPRL